METNSVADLIKPSEQLQKLSEAAGAEGVSTAKTKRSRYLGIGQSDLATD
ncbi:MAG TPA: hypothetical protein VLE19_09610 [Pyrinomonadaceae bacterium]|nr:hypothetical protein [Pyrinomonadaceae bacterium]